MDFVGLGCDRICEVSYKLIGHLIYMKQERYFNLTINLIWSIFLDQNPTTLS